MCNENYNTVYGNLPIVPCNSDCKSNETNCQQYVCNQQCGVSQGWFNVNKLPPPPTPEQSICVKNCLSQEWC